MVCPSRQIDPATWAGLTPSGAEPPTCLMQRQYQGGLGLSEDMLGPTFPLEPGQACLPGSGVPHDSPLLGHLLRDLPQTRLALPGEHHFILF